MRTALFLLTCLFLVTACADGDNYYGGNDNDDRYYGDSRGYGGYGNYYPYGNASYPRNRSYVMDHYRPCNGYAYQGYCYLYRDDYQRAIAWDRSHGYDDNWHKKRKNWCNEHDCSRGHDNDYGRDGYYDRDGRYGRDGRNGTTDAQGRPLQPRVEKDGAATVYPDQIHPDQKPRQPHPRSTPSRDDKSSGSRPYPSHAPVTRQEPLTRQEPVIRQDSEGGHVQRYRQQPVQRDEPVQRQQRAEPVQRSQPAGVSTSQPTQERKSQRARSGRVTNTDITPE